MRNKTSLFKRSLAALLSFVMVLGMLPAFDMVPEAEAYTHTDANTDTQGSEFIALPIIIRDFPADGMLFENNEYGSSGTGTIGSTATGTGINVLVNPDSIGNYMTLDEGTDYEVTKYDYELFSIVLTVAASVPTGFTHQWWKTIYVNADGTINRVVAAGVADEDTTIPTGGFMIGYHSGNTYDTTFYSAITEETKDSYTFGYTTTDPAYGDATLYRYPVVESELAAGTYNYANNAGFGLLHTDAATHGDITLDPTVTSGVAALDGIQGTAMLMNGSYNAETIDTTYTMGLNSGADQVLHGGWIRTNLVEANLPEDKNLVYTQYAVKFLAEYLKATLEEEWQASDGSYNLWYVMGDKLFNDNNQYVGKGHANATRDLAAVLRSQIMSDGTYTEAKTAFGTEALNSIQDIDTYFDAAYFLLHSTFDDVEGYGLRVPEYNEIRLVQKTKADGTIYYTFNSAFDDTDYNDENGYIVNTQTTTITDRSGSETTESWTRGNIQALNRFDPLGPSGLGAGNELGYGMSGSIYKDYYNALGIEAAVYDHEDGYYENTNYNLSLEGHAEFVYHYSSNLYFTFTGDDDVYLFINGVRVLDLGGAHAISKATINLNDVAVLCGLQEGGTYQFDFYYMERHGTAANFGIETNIQLAESGMITTKQGYQNGVSTGYDGPVDPSKPVAYSFTLTNSGDATLEHLTFEDPKLGVKLTESEITLNSESNLENMYVYIRDQNNAITDFYSASTTPALNEEVLKGLLLAGLPEGYSMTIYNLRYTIPEAEWTNATGNDERDTFTNVVNTTAIANGKQLHGTADWKVHKADLVITPFHIYNWVDKDLKDTEWNARNVELTKAELTQPAVNANSALDVSGATIVLCNGSGNENTALWSEAYTNIVKNITWGENYSLTYNSKSPGLETVYYKVKGIGYDDLIYHFDVITYGVADNVYVLDYGLNVELNCDQYGFRVNDHLTVPQNIHTTTMTMDVHQDEHTWGEFVNNGQNLDIDDSVEYRPKAIINGCDSMTVTIKLRETNADTSKALKFYGVDMTQSVSTAPANVVYYEENFPGITYVNGEGEDGNQWVHYETVDEDGNSVAGTNQSPDQDSNYGSDPNYAEDKVGTIVSGDSVGTVVGESTLNLDTTDLDALQAAGIEYLNQYLGLGGSDSNGSVNQLVVKETAEVMFFEFVGTGFEIISRTTANQYAVINVQVQKKNADDSYTIVRQVPVITESKGGDLYQVPIISVTGLDKATYRVVVKAGTTGNVTRVLYIDGIRIYGPLEDDNKALEYYNPEEYQAEFFEVKQLIQDGHAIYSDASNSDDDLQLVTGSTLVENTLDPGEGSVLMSIESLADYMSVGPNNELYLDGNAASGMIAFFLTPVADYPDAARTLEIGAHRKSDSSYSDDGDVYMTYGSTATDILDGTYIYDIGSGTEMYYTIDVNNLTLRDGKYLVMIGTNGSENYGTTLALTSIKVAGYEISFAETAIQTASFEATLDTLAIVQEPFAVLRARLNAIEEEPEVENVPVNQNLTVNSASLKVAKVVSGKVATLTVKAGADAETIVITDAEGNVMEATRCTRNVSGGVATFTFIWQVYGSRGDALDFTVRVYDANGLASVNTETVTVTIK